MSLELTYLYTCNNCESTLIDCNPGLGSVKYAMLPEDLMRLRKLGVVKDSYACPICLTDDFLTHNIKLKQ